MTLSLTAPAKKSAGPATPSRPVLRPEYVIRRMRVTAYCPCCDCCGPRARGVTANGTHIWKTDGYFLAADPAIPFGTRLSVPGYAMDRPVPVLDRGRAVTTDCVDVYFADHRTAKRWGVRWLDVKIYNRS
ncbi:MAG: 3D domain-containing protein [Planctomycetaceae bacterium]|nr:3D domain-containing protein [Planctomycetaceae bacterium]